LIGRAQLDEALRHGEAVLLERARLDGDDDRAGGAEAALDEDPRVAGPLVQIDADEGAPGSLRVVAPEGQRLPLPCRRRLARPGLRFQLEQNDPALRRRGSADARPRRIAVRGRRSRGQRESEEGERG